MITPDQNRVYVKKETYGSYDPEPPRDAPIEVFALGPTTSNISLHKNLWVADYSQTYLIDAQGIQGSDARKKIKTVLGLVMYHMYQNLLLEAATAREAARKPEITPGHSGFLPKVKLAK
ncbi:unnamed protein product [Allacma fusca]|uniref:Uncharacterized protein n=1 Tax=Allacma fusca TaxID=39272 RepID=A0A8J2P6S3_9HEXA|nr:unnamed protein product [Allacma fusca]